MLAASTHPDYFGGPEAEKPIGQSATWICKLRQTAQLGGPQRSMLLRPARGGEHSQRLVKSPESHRAMLCCC